MIYKILNGGIVEDQYLFLFFSYYLISVWKCSTTTSEPADETESSRLLNLTRPLWAWYGTRHPGLNPTVNIPLCWDAIRSPETAVQLFHLIQHQLNLESSHYDVAAYAEVKK